MNDKLNAELQSQLLIHFIISLNLKRWFTISLGLYKTYIFYLLETPVYILLIIIILYRKLTSGLTSEL